MNNSYKYTKNLKFCSKSYKNTDFIMPYNISHTSFIVSEIRRRCMSTSNTRTMTC
jgi:hypothetical protein